ncbi:MAG: Rieske 2Fe-2S domain-containing protein [Planctomycetales bacterium]
MSKTQIIQVSDIKNGTSRVVEIQGHELVVFHVQGEFYVLSNLCPHVGGPLNEGPLSGHTVTCPWHGWQFDVRTGQRPGEGKSAPCFPTSIEDDWVVVELPDPTE